MLGRITADEGKAEKTICISCPDNINRNYIHCSACTRCDDFIKGFAEGKPKWHDLRKNPDDLPKDDGKYIIYIKISERVSITDTCDFFKRSFGRYITPTAWCELPKFEE